MISAIELSDLVQRARAVLDGFRLPALRQLRLDAAEGSVTVSGRVATFYERQLAIESCKRVPGVRTVIDRVEVT